MADALNVLTDRERKLLELANQIREVRAELARAEAELRNTRAALESWENRRREIDRRLDQTKAAIDALLGVNEDA